MDHVDWLDTPHQEELAAALAQQVEPELVHRIQLHHVAGAPHGQALERLAEHVGVGLGAGPDDRHATSLSACPRRHR